MCSSDLERLEEEARGHVRWLRPDYQRPRFGKGLTQETAMELDLGDTVVAIDKGLPAFPKERFEQPLAVSRILARSGQPMTADAIARAFKGRDKNRLHRIEQILTVLVRYGDISRLADGRYAHRLAA